TLPLRLPNSTRLFSLVGGCAVAVLVEAVVVIKVTSFRRGDSRGQHGVGLLWPDLVVRPQECKARHLRVSTVGRWAGVGALARLRPKALFNAVEWHPRAGVAGGRKCGRGFGSG